MRVDARQHFRVPIETSPQLSPAALEALAVIARQVLDTWREADPRKCLFVQRNGPAPAHDPGEYRLLLEDENEDFLYVCGFADAAIRELAAAQLLTPCELEGDPREHFSLNSRGIECCRAVRLRAVEGAKGKSRPIH